MAETKLTTRVSETTSTTGTGTLDLNGAQTGYRGFSDELTSGDETWYLITDSATSPTLYEAGRGTFTTGSPNTLSRDTVVASSNSGNKVSLPVGTAIVSGSPSKEFIDRLSAISTESVTLPRQTTEPTTGSTEGALFTKNPGDGTSQLFFRGQSSATSVQVTNASGVVPPASATTTTKGVVELATDAEALAGTDTTRAVTSSGLASNKSLAASGYIEFPGGVYLQWGTGTGGSAVTFPTAFPNNCRAVVFAPTQAASFGNVSSPTTTGFTPTTRNDTGANTSVAGLWIAVGD